MSRAYNYKPMKTIILFLTLLISTNTFSQTVMTYENFYDVISICLSTNSKRLKTMIFDVFGEVVLEKNVTDKIDISSLKTGIYFIRPSIDIKSFSYKIVKD